MISEVIDHLRYNFNHPELKRVDLFDLSLTMGFIQQISPAQMFSLISF